MSDDAVIGAVHSMQRMSQRIRDLKGEVDMWRDKYRAADNNWDNEVDELMECIDALKAKLEAVRRLPAEWTRHPLGSRRQCIEQLQAILEQEAT